MNDRHVEHHGDGSVTLREGGRVRAAASADAIALTKACEDFFEADLAMPSDLPMHRLRLFLIASGRKGEVANYLKSLAEPARSLALEEFEYAPTFMPHSPLGRATQAALGLSDADYAHAVRSAAAARVDDYGAPRSRLMATIARFLFGG